MAMKVIRKAYFFRTEQDKTQRRAFILRWSMDKEKNVSAFTIDPPDLDENETTIVSKYACTAEEEFDEMVRMMKLMIRPVEVTIKC